MNPKPMQSISELRTGKRQERKKIEALVKMNLTLQLLAEIRMTIRDVDLETMIPTIRSLIDKITLEVEQQQ